MQAGASGAPTSAHGFYRPPTPTKPAPWPTVWKSSTAERREIEAEVRAAAMAQAEERGLDAPLVWAAGEGWHPGVVGIVAARLKEATNPAPPW